MFTISVAGVSVVKLFNAVSFLRLFNHVPFCLEIDFFLFFSTLFYFIVSVAVTFRSKLLSWYLVQVNKAQHAQKGLDPLRYKDAKGMLIA